MPTAPNWRAGSRRAVPFSAACSWSTAKSRRWPACRNGIAERIIPEAQVFRPVLDDIYELSTPAPTPLDVGHRRRLAPEAVVSLDWHNDMSKLILDINDEIEAAADDRARGVVIRSGGRLERA